jgi:hypothetical protein
MNENELPQLFVWKKKNLNQPILLTIAGMKRNTASPESPTESPVSSPNPSSSSDGQKKPRVSCLGWRRACLLISSLLNIHYTHYHITILFILDMLE